MNDPKEIPQIVEEETEEWTFSDTQKGNEKWGSIL